MCMKLETSLYASACHYIYVYAKQNVLEDIFQVAACLLIFIFELISVYQVPHEEKF